jgi:hypothetical protein
MTLIKKFWRRRAEPPTWRGYLPADVADHTVQIPVIRTYLAWSEWVLVQQS